ncbi:MAG: pyridoxamine 5'-phosphate oxidase family protein [Myxococcota bacterium]
MASESPFHRGEREVQSRMGVREAIEPWARRVVRPFLTEEFRVFFSELPFVVLAARDASGRPWATLLAEEPGFLSSPDPQGLRFAALPPEGDALDGALQTGDDVGLLGIELHSRRRNRVNGRVGARGASGFSLEVDQGFGNCPQYITERRWQRAEPAPRRAAARRSTRLDAAQRAFVENADTFFIATGYRGEGEDPVFGMDASHRGGAPGFLRAASDRELVFPDYAGNNHFNTIGNLTLDARAGLTLVDFERGDMLQLTGRARIDWDSPEVAQSSGARRLVHFEIDEVVELEGALPLRWESAGGSIRELRLIEKRQESADVRSFVFASRDDGPLPRHVAGQYLPLEFAVEGEDEPLRRTYSLSSAPGGPHYRISVKREPQGAVSRFLHDQLEEGQFVRAGEPRGEFVLHAAGTQPVVLVSAGVGLTPLLSMLHAWADDDGDARPIWFVHGARDGAHHPLREEVERLVAEAPGASLHVAYSQQRAEDTLGEGHHSVGRVDAALLEKLVPGLDADFYLCGPTAFMADLQDALEGRGVSAERIRSESFGPAGAGPPR